MAEKKPSWFTRFAKWAAHWTGTHYAFTLAISIIVIWGLTGPIFSFNDTWQLVINTGTTIVTFLMVFLIQNTQNRDSAAIQIKLDEVIRTIEGAHNALLDLEEMDEEELEQLRNRYEKLASRARDKLAQGLEDIERADIELRQAEAEAEEAGDEEEAEVVEGAREKTKEAGEEVKKQVKKQAKEK
jgi:low affinity Fe/Cu permease